MGRIRTHEVGLYRHSFHVAKLVTDYTRYIGLSFDTAWPMIEGGLLHDIGKTLLPSSLLVKKKPLNEAERQMMTLHPGIGAALLEAQGYFTYPVIAIVKNHHERLDGSGYPKGLRKSTARAVRVVAVCDAFCAMTESRPYEGAWPIEAAMDRLQSMTDQYDEEVVKVLGEILEAKKHGWSSEDTKVDVPAELILKAHRRPGLVHPRSAFFEPVYPAQAIKGREERAI